MEGGTKAIGGREVDVSKLLPAEYGGFAAAAVLFGSLFLPWFSASGNGTINGMTDVTLNAFETYGLLDILLVLACSAPFILGWIVTRGHKLTWKPGEVTMIVGLIAFTLILLNGVILGRPGDIEADISIKIGYPIGLIGAAGIAVSGFFRQAQSTQGRKPPGVL